jgi:hypothetical protein
MWDNISVNDLTMIDPSLSSDVKTIATDYTKASLVSALKDQDAVVSFLGSPAMGEAQLSLIDAAAKAGVKRFISSEFGHNTDSEKVIRVLPVLGGKRSTIALIKSHPRLTWTAVITGLFFDWGLKISIGVDAEKAKATVWDAGDVPFSTTNLRTIGQTLIKVLTDSAAYEDSKNRYIYLASHTTTQNELVAAAEKATGKKFEITTVNGAETVAEATQKLATGDYSGILSLIAGLAFSKIEGEALADYRGFGIFNDKHGIKDVSLEEDVKNIVTGL